jgi:hypothetical protein
MRECDEIPCPFIEFRESRPGVGCLEVVTNTQKDLFQIRFVFDFTIDVRIVCHKSHLLSSLTLEQFLYQAPARPGVPPPGHGRWSQSERWLLIVRAGEHSVWAAVVLLT